MSEQERLELAEWAYQGEVSGDALFGAMANMEPDSQRAGWLDEMRRLEVQTAALLERLVRRLGGDPTASPESRERGQRMARRASEGDWQDFLEAFEPVTADALARYRRLRELVDAGDVEIVDAVIAHEEALADFARAALADNEDPVAPVRRLLVT